MIVTLITQTKIDSITLPEKVRGQFWLQLCQQGLPTNMISIEANKDDWILKSNRKITLMGAKGQPIRNTKIEPQSIYNLSVVETGEMMHVFVETSTNDRQEYKKYIISRNAGLTIGRDRTNDIVVANQFISAQHARLQYQDNKWSVFDLKSTNGTFVNGSRVKTKQIEFGDVLWIMGLKIIFGTFFLAINNPDAGVELLTNELVSFINQKVINENTEDADDEVIPVNYFYRSPRFKRDVESAVIKIDSPPQNAVGEEVPFMLIVGPSLTMGMASMTTAAFAINNALTTGNVKSALPSIVMSGSMLLGTVLWPILTKRFEKRRKKRKEALRQKKYKEYLDRISVKISEECERQEEILRDNFPMVRDCLGRIVNLDRNLWERGLGQNDFLELRVGVGTGKLAATISYSERKFTIDEDNLQEELYTLCEKPKELLDIPITLSLFDDYISGIIGDRKQVKEFVKGLIFQITSLYSYDEVKLVFIYSKNDSDDFEFVKWLPHVWSNDRKFRFISTGINEVKETSAYLEREFANRSFINENDMDDVTPYYVVIALDKALADKTEILKLINAKKKNLHFSVLNCYDELRNLPKECTMVVELDKDAGKLFDKNDITGQTIPFTPDIFLNTDPLALSVKLANVQLDILAGSFKLPKMITFLEMFGVGNVEHLNILTRWKDNNPTQSLRAEVGVDTTGELFHLDLHEKFHGPHGLVAGMTGSGKSEFIITYILSLAVNYHPNEVAFILIDYKGGGMAKSFENLPHTAGIITNLDGAAIKRSLISIQSELKRRQAIFAQVSKAVGVSNIDIYKYQKLYREGTVTEPLQHLFIISDEFAELKTQQPEFMTQLVSAARIGRSLGIHLILATQKPAGVVDDQIWSNSKFRVCLKVQERADSMDMLKRPDAAELTDTGRFYLQVGYNELFEMGQSAWAGAPYYPSDRAVVERDNSVVVIDANGRPVREVKVDNRKIKNPNPSKQLDVITDYLRTIAEEENIKVRPLWLDPIPAVILLKSLRDKYTSQIQKTYLLNPIIGEYDDPTRQQQCVLRVPLSEDGNVIIYGAAGSGKTTFLNTMIYSLITAHTPDEVNIYILDFASETLRAFSKAPHIGDVVLSFESEKISNLLKMLKSEMDCRKKAFADFGGDYRSYVETTGNKLPSIVIIINNYSAFTEIYDSKEEAVSLLSREGTKYGIYFVLTALGTGAIRFRMLQNFKQLFVLQMNDESDYSTVLGKTEGLVPSKCKGRGLVKKDMMYEFQTAQITEDAVPFSFIQNESLRLKESWDGKCANRIPILPEVVDCNFLKEYIDPKKQGYMPIGVEKNSLGVYFYPFIQNYINMILSTANDAQVFAYDFANFLASTCNYDISFLDSNQAFVDRNREFANYYSTQKDLDAQISELFDMVLMRNNLYKDSLESTGRLEPFERKIIFMNSVLGLKNSLSGELKEKLALVLEKGDSKLAVTIIIIEPAKNLASMSFEKWYKNHASPYDGIWVGSGISEQYQLKPTKMTSELREELPSGFGFAVQKGKAVKIKLLSSDKGGLEDYE